MKCKRCKQPAKFDRVTRHEFIFKTSIEKKKLVKDRSNAEFIIRTNYCRMCLIELGYRKVKAIY